ncbi:unnamed protein product [Microthlaspi erraticum]|uniref:Phytocyanin domain-containing protein n=1 Tax=Microthlaspi erraticum TaxID=1685480 RepID=A0A6D2J2Z4_9BRAS|nr:unnamed protein product [Microthlaspi erraticum]CAA7050221.1 unnamed protein product [Microthlaspi erraticum]
MALIKSKSFFTSLLILVALIGAAVGGTVHKVGDSKGWTMMGADYEAWASSRTFKVGDSLVFEYDNEYHDVTEVTPNDFELCEPSSPLARYETGSDTVSLTKPGIRYFICGFPGHCKVGQKLQILVLPASLGPVAAPVPGPVRSRSSSSSPSPSPLADAPVNKAPQYQMGPSSPSPAPVPRSVRPRSSSSSPSPSPLANAPVNNGPQYKMEPSPSPAPQSAASNSSVWIGSYFLVYLLSLFILV